MTVQNIINEVNSIQSKKKAIKDAITAKGVTSEGKLSKFADEISQITTKEPDWYIVNKFRYENGNEALMVRTSDKNVKNANKYQMVEIGAGVTRDNDINNSFNSYYNDELSITNGTYFHSEAAYRSYATKENYNIVFNGHNDNLKLKFGDKEIVFNDVNVYNWLKGYRNQPLADYNTLYLKCGGVNGGNIVSLSDFLARSLTPNILTLGVYGQIPALLIDSSVMVQAMKFKEVSRVGFIYYSDKTIDTVSLNPVFYINTETSYALPYDNKEEYYGNLSPGNYVHLLNKNGLLIVFVSINFVVDSNDQKHKNIEVYMYTVTGANNTKINNKPFELYLTFSSEAQKQLQRSASIKIYRRQTLTANSTPEPRESNFLTGKDMLMEFKTRKATNTSAISPSPISNLFLKDQRTNFIDCINPPNSSFNFVGKTIAAELINNIKNNVKTTGFIRLNETDMFSIELESATDEVNNFLKTSQFKFDTNKNKIFKNALWISHNGFPGLNNRTIIFIPTGENRNINFYYLKKGNNYITNDEFSTAQKTHYLYLTTDTETQNYLNSKSLSDIWTEAQGVLAYKTDFEAYYEKVD